MLSGKATNTNFLVFGLTRPGLEPTIYRTRGEHIANHYVTDVVSVILRHVVCKLYNHLLLSQEITQALKEHLTNITERYTNSLVCQRWNI